MSVDSAATETAGDEPWAREDQARGADRWPTRICTGSRAARPRPGARRWATARASCARGSCWRPAPGAARATPPSRSSRRTISAALGGWDAARALGVDVLVGGRDPQLHAAAIAGGARSIWRLYFRSGENRDARVARIEARARARGRRPRGPGA